MMDRKFLQFPALLTKTLQGKIMTKQKSLMKEKAMKSPLSKKKENEEKNIDNDEE